MPTSPIPTIDVLPPMTPKVREVLYGVLSWAAFLVTLTLVGVGLAPDADVPTWLTITSGVLNAAWTLGGFKAKANVDVKDEWDHLDDEAH